MTDAIARLAPDQQAVLSLLVRRQRTYAQVASMLGIDPAAVRKRAQGALVALAGDPPVDADGADIERAGDYVLGQLSEGERIEVLALLMDDSRCRAWARRLAGELEPFAGRRLPQIPDDEEAYGAMPEAARVTGHAGADVAARAAAAPCSSVSAAAPGAPAAPGREAPRRRSFGGWPSFAVAIATVAMVLAAILVFVLGSGGSSAPPPGPIPASAARLGATGGVATGAASTSAGAASTSAGAASTSAGASGSSQILAEVGLAPAAGAGAAKGEVAVLKSGSGTYVVFEASHLPSPGSDHYVLWLYDSPSRFQALGEVPSVSAGTAGPLQVAAPSDLADFDGVLLTLESSARPTHPGRVVLRGTSSTPL